MGWVGLGYENWTHGHVCARVILCRRFYCGVFRFFCLAGPLGCEWFLPDIISLSFALRASSVQYCHSGLHSLARTRTAISRSTQLCRRLAWPPTSPFCWHQPSGSAAAG